MILVTGTPICTIMQVIDGSVRMFFLSSGHPLIRVSLEETWHNCTIAGIYKVRTNSDVNRAVLQKI